MTIDAQRVFDFKSLGICDQDIVYHDDLSANFSLSWRVPESLPYFEGHFPSNPIMPAVAIIDASVSFLEQVLSKNLAVSKLINCKFTGAVPPSTCVLINYDLQDNTNFGIDCQVVWASNNESGQTFAQLKMQLRS